jgi:hypothetical protein
VARASVRGRRQVVAKGSARARKAGSVVVQLRLSRKARSQLSRSKATRVTLAIKAADARSGMTLRLKRAK